jgi:hypothetical protein
MAWSKARNQRRRGRERTQEWREARRLRETQGLGGKATRGEGPAGFDQRGVDFVGVVAEKRHTAGVEDTIDTVIELLLFCEVAGS